MKVVVETGGMCLNDKEHQGLPATPRSWERAWNSPQREPAPLTP